MRSAFILDIPDPCSQKWSEMIPAAKGRFCNSCEKEIIDFSIKSDAEIVRFLNNKPEKVCGRFHPSQLSREIRVSNSKISGHSLSSLVALAITMTITPGYTQETVAQTNAVINQTILKDSIETTIIRGNLISISGEPIVGALVELWNKTEPISRTKSDFDGKFAVEIPEGKSHDVIKIYSQFMDTMWIEFVSGQEHPLLNDLKVTDSANLTSIETTIDKEIVVMGLVIAEPPKMPPIDPDSISIDTKATGKEKRKIRRQYRRSQR